MKKLLLAGAAAVTLMCSSVAMAEVNLGISIGIPGVIISEPDYYYPPVRYVEPAPRVIVVPERRYYRRPVYRSHYYRDDYRVYRGHGNHGHRGHGHHKGHHRD